MLPNKRAYRPKVRYRIHRNQFNYHNNWSSHRNGSRGIRSCYPILKYFFGMYREFSVHELPNFYITLVPAIGGLIVGIISYFLMKKRYGVDGLIETVALRRARFKLRDIFLEIFTSIFTISSEGALGKEAPGILAGAGTELLQIEFLKPGRATSNSSWL